MEEDQFFTQEIMRILDDENYVEISIQLDTLKNELLFESNKIQTEINEGVNYVYNNYQHMC